MKHYCRFCNKLLTTVFVDLGNSPLSNSFLTIKEVNMEEVFHSLCTYVCDKCLLVQLPEFESPEHIFREYPYFSSYSTTWLKHAEEFVEMITKKYDFNDKSTIIEIASNDGYLLQYFKGKNIPILGIEPAANVAQVAQEKGIPTLIKFFGVNTANELVKDSKKGDCIIANNVLAHVPDLNDFVKGLKILLKQDGIITIEFPHLLQLIKNTQFDTIYHEHFSYFSLIVIKKIFSFHGLTVFDVDELSTHGGSLRIYVKHSENSKIIINKNVYKILEMEKIFGLSNMSSYSKFSEDVKCVKKQMCDFFINAKKNGKKIVGYGAAAKGNSLFNYCKIEKKDVEYVVDKNPHKQGLFLPGSHIPIKNPKIIMETKPDYVIILPWNIKEEVMEENAFIREWGGKFVIPIPRVVIV
jgi:2-polyprenyl-3-methyl-5-hydroxy-6-metoxy-1,4-benzoquinol methylase